MVPQWLHIVSIVSLSLSALCALAVTFDIVFLGRRQKMMIMSVVWPLTTLAIGPLAFGGYLWLGRPSDKAAEHDQKGHSPGSSFRRPPAGARYHPDAGLEHPGHEHGRKRPFWQSVALGTTHCSAGCALGDAIGEWALFLLGVTFLGSKLLTAYVFDFVLAYLFGIVFQYFSIAPMRGLGFREGLAAALKADTLSLVAFEIGMFGWMALSRLVLFRPPLEPTQPTYWFMMQLAMVVGFLTSYPANWWLISRKLKEAM